MQPLPISYLGYLYGAGVSWNAMTHLDDECIMTALDMFAFCDRAGIMGKLAHELGNIYREPGVLTPNASILFLLVLRPERPLAETGLTVEGLKRTLIKIDQVMAPLARADMSRPDASLIMDEFNWVADMLRWSCRLGIARLQHASEGQIPDLPKTVKHELVSPLSELIVRYRALWLSRNQCGGLDDSCARLDRLLTYLT